jgi:signal transduction histidine kinase
MTNAFRHAGAMRIEASLRFEPRREAPNLRDPALAGLVMRVADDGRGLNGEGEAGMGLAGMRDRVRLMGGSVKIDSPQGGGVVVEACFTPSDPTPMRENFPALSGIKPDKISNH